MTVARAWRLRSILAGALVFTMTLTFGIVGSAILLVRIPQLGQESQNQVAREARELTTRMEMLLGALESQMRLIGHSVEVGSSDLDPDALLDHATADGNVFRAIYLVSTDGRVQAAGVPPALRPRRQDLLGSDLSSNQIFRAMNKERQVVWGDKYLSGLSGSVTVALAFPLRDGRSLLAEVPLSHLLSTLQLAAGERNAFIWLVDRSGEIVANTAHGPAAGPSNILNLPIMQAAVDGRPLPATFAFDGHAFHPGVAFSKRLEWYFVAARPAGWDAPEIRDAVLFVASGFIGSLLIGLLLAPWLASWLTRSLGHIVVRAGQVTRDEPAGEWPRGRITEFNDLSSDIEKMAHFLQERKQKLAAIFDVTPVPIIVKDADSPFLIRDVNEAWCREFGFARDDALGRSSAELGIWATSADHDQFAAEVRDGSETPREIWLTRRDGSRFLCQTFGCEAVVGDAKLKIWASVDVSDIRRISNELRELNAELEARVAHRTRALETLNAELSNANAILQNTQAELTRAAKMAALGNLVAGVAHELNTPIGNCMLVVTSLADELRAFKASMHAGIRKSTLDNLIDVAEQTTDLASRNLQRAADLVTSFKQVAVDQTSAQRRRFEPAEIVGEMVSSLRPSLRRTPYQIVVDVPASGLAMDSYPGALGQVIGNLIDNAVLHGFDGRDHGVIHILGARHADGLIALTIADDGHGIAASLIGRVFDPFVTTRMGRGGTGLGLHIAYNAVVNVLGGKLTVESVPGQGTTFRLLLPSTAPQAEMAAQDL